MSRLRAVVVGLEQDGADVLVFVRAKPRASRSLISGDRDGEIEISLRAPPVDGAANEELVRFLSKILRVPKSRVRLERGERSRHKVVRVEGLTRDVAESALKA